MLRQIGTLLFNLGAALALFAGWMRLCDSSSDLAGEVLGACVTLALIGCLVMPESVQLSAR